MKVNRSLDKSVVSIQFPDDLPLSRATEYHLMTKVQDAGFVYKPERKQWERFDSEQPGANVIYATELAKEIVRDRGARGR